ncbi:MAG: hypothetical protein CVU11_00620, partial [Bacteroidetes bacterium HGW-Bacteroidetes-6]
MKSKAKKQSSMKSLFTFFSSVFVLIFFAVPGRADVLLNEPFSGGVLPTGWTNTNIQGAAVWTFRSIPSFSGFSGGNYAVFDDNALGAGVIPNEAALTSRSVNCSGRTSIFLSYYTYWFAVEFTHGYVEVSNDGGTTWNTVVDYENTTVGSLAAPSKEVIDISALAANQTDVRVRFRYTDGSQAGRYWYIDDVVIYAGPDVGVTELQGPLRILSCGTSYSAAENVTVVLKNYSADTISNVPVRCDITGTIITTLTGTYAGSIAPGASVSYTFPAPVSFSNTGEYYFQIYTELAGDAYLLNDTLIDGRYQPTSDVFTVVQDFNNSPSGWYTNTGTGSRHWKYGALPGSYLGGPSGEGNSWYFEWLSDGTGGVAQTDYLYSPVFDLSGMTNPLLSFDMKADLCYSH